MTNTRTEVCVTAQLPSASVSFCVCFIYFKSTIVCEREKHRLDFGHKTWDALLSWSIKRIACSVKQLVNFRSADQFFLVLPADPTRSSPRSPTGWPALTTS